MKMNEHNIVAKAEKQVKEWIDYAKQEYGWEDKVFELFEEPMIEVATSVAVQTVKDLQKENERLENKLSEAIHLIENIIRVTWGEGWNYSLDWKVKAMQFLENKQCSQKECTILEQN